MRPFHTYIICLDHGEYHYFSIQTTGTFKAENRGEGAKLEYGRLNDRIRYASKVHGEEFEVGLLQNVLFRNRFVIGLQTLYGG